MGLEVVTPPANPPVDQSEVEKFLRYDDTLQASIITTLIDTARREVERFTNRALVNTDFAYYVPDFKRNIPLPVSGIDSSTVSIQYIDTNDVLQTVDPSLYGIDAISEIPSVYEEYNGNGWPTDVKCGDPNAVKISFTAGFGADESAVPAGIKEAIYLLVGGMFEERESDTPVRIETIPIVARVLELYRVHRQ